ncbi:hypothetical protein BaRGS_00004388 [Batillaria attramentaria]|uniref:Uncharacterized protein n=1 Tax=Batillaria attramentaria TaxID=370345 RepID=A0ABD0LZW5_9CAEN
MDVHTKPTTISSNRPSIPPVVHNVLLQGREHSGIADRQEALERVAARKNDPIMTLDKHCASHFSQFSARAEPSSRTYKNILDGASFATVLTKTSVHHAFLETEWFPSQFHAVFDWEMLEH